MNRITFAVIFVFFVLAFSLRAEDLVWDFSSPDFQKSISSGEVAAEEAGGISFKSKHSLVRMTMKSFEEKRSVSTVTVSQAPTWLNWNPIENLGPSNLQDAPVLLTLGPDDYWIFGRFGNGQPRRKNG